MNILTISLNAWNDTQATGNTFSNFFGNKDNDIHFSNIYCRNEPYDNHICSKYYRVTELDIIRSLKTRSHTCGGVIYENSRSTKAAYSGKASSFKDSIMHKYRPSLLLFLREILWNTNKWKTIELDRFLEEVSPDIIYMHGHNNRYMHKILWYCQMKTNAKVVVFWGDDMYGFKSYRPGQLLYHLWLRKQLKYTIQHANMLLGGSETLCIEYSERFKREFRPQYKVCNFILQPNEIKVKRDLCLVYAGNLLYGRKELLIAFSKVLARVNENCNIKIRLHIYSASSINESERPILDDKYNCYFEGPKPYNEICNILNNCDASLFLESFDKANIRQTRLSFSTKIIDYLQSSSSLIVYGPIEIASVQYLKKSSVALIAHSEHDLFEVLKKVQLNPFVLNDFAKRKYEFARNNHSSSTLISRFRELMQTNN